MSDLVGNPEDRFSHNEAHIIAVYLLLNFPFTVRMGNVLVTLRRCRDILGKKSNGPPAINFPYSRTAGQIFIIYTSF